MKKWMKRLWLFIILLPFVLIYAFVEGIIMLWKGEFDDCSWNPWK
ncbi:MAG: hypothetical protein NUV80_02710 [Candidatus Berkelbacteria bacterium]|nr:hypothetical protein [Candidatus Berkelbacteria bacterium]